MVLSALYFKTMKNLCLIICVLIGVESYSQTRPSAFMESKNGFVLVSGQKSNVRAIAVGYQGTFLRSEEATIKEISREDNMFEIEPNVSVGDTCFIYVHGVSNNEKYPAIACYYFVVQNEEK